MLKSYKIMVLVKPKNMSSPKEENISSKPSLKNNCRDLSGGPVAKAL